MAYDESEERDDHGRWSGGGGGGGDNPIAAAEASGMSPEEFEASLAGVTRGPGEGPSEAAWEATARDLSPNELAGVEAYTADDYGPMNGYLRGDGEEFRSDAVEEKIAWLDSAIAKQAPSGDPTTLYRAVSGDVATEYRGLSPGDVLTDPAFISTTVSQEFGDKSEAYSAMIAEGAAPPGYNLGQSLEIRAPAGSQGLWAVPHSAYAEEREVILPRGSAFQVVEQQSYKTVVTLLK